MTKPTPSVAEVFTKASQHLLKQKVRATSVEAPDFCMYHCEDGRKCPVGLFIPEGKAKGLENMTIRDREVLEALSINLTPDTKKLLADLQKLHDTVPPKAWASRLKDLARKYVKLGVLNTPSSPRSKKRPSTAITRNRKM